LVIPFRISQPLLLSGPNREPIMIYVGNAARFLREKLGLSQREAANQLRISYVHLSNLENNKAAPTRNVLEKFRKVWGIDLYVLSWCMNGDINKLPLPLRDPARKLTEAWKKQIEELRMGRKV
jgi:transcriptional regulator with XRE-family HTH domain